MLLEIKNLSVEYYRRKKTIPAVRNVSLSIDAGETLGIVGESGCGKSTLALSILRLIAPSEGRIRQGEIFFDHINLAGKSEKEMREIRGKEIGMIFQDPFSSLNPVIRIGEQIEEAIICHQFVESNYALKEKAQSLLKQVRLPDPDRIYESYPHRISGGQRQRVMIAIAIANRPKLLIADEPTTALDVTVQKEILELMALLQKELEMAILLVTHHLGIISKYTEKLVVLYAGEVVEQGNTPEIIRNPQHPYTQALLRSLPKRKQGSMRSSSKKNRLFMIQGHPPDLSQLPEGCIFHTRCQHAVDDCKVKVPHLRSLEPMQRMVACHLAPFESADNP